MSAMSASDMSTMSASDCFSRNTAAFHYRYNFYEKSFNWRENDWSIRLVGGLVIKGIDAQFIGRDSFETLAKKFHRHTASDARI